MTSEQYPDAAQEWVSKGFTMEAEVAWLENSPCTSSTSDQVYDVRSASQSWN